MARLALTAALSIFIASMLLAAGASGGGASTGSPPSPGDFVRRVDNPWFPLIPGTTFVYRGVKDGKAARDVVHVTPATKTIQGVRCTSVSDRLFLAGHLAERTEGSWQAGKNGARAGVFLTARPRVGQTGIQEYYKGHAEDHYAVVSVRALVSVPYVSSNRAVLTKEWTPLEPGTLDHKYYVRGIGNVKEVTVKGPLERAELVSVRHG